MRYDPVSLLQEYRHARDVLARRSDGVRDMVQQMAAGLSLDRRGEAAVRMIEPHYHEYVAYVRPRIAGGTPVCRVETPRAGVARVEAAAGEAAVNQWIKDTRHVELVRKISTDYLIGWGIGGLRLDRLPGQETDDFHTTPVAFRIEREDAFWDVMATSWEDRQFAGFNYAIAKEDLIERAREGDGWNLEVVKALPTDLDGEDGTHKPTQRDTLPMRGECTVREIWCPRVLTPNAPKWATGTIFTLGGGAKEFLREPRPFFGPPWGPIYLFDAYYIPGQSLGAAPCELVREQVEELNRHANALSRDTAARKKIALADLINAEDAKRINAAPHGSLQLLQGLSRDKFVEFEVGGGTNEQRQALAELKIRLRESSGLGEAQRGAVSGAGTATENAIAAESSGVRIGDLADRFASCHEMMLSGVLWYVLHTKSLRIKLRPEDVGIPERFELTVRGGMRPGLAWEDFRLRVDAFTLARESDAARRARVGRAVATALSIAQVAPQIAPFADVTKLLKLAGEAENVPELETLVDADSAAALFGAQAAGEGPEPEVEVAPEPTAARPMVQPGKAKEYAA